MAALALSFHRVAVTGMGGNIGCEAPLHRGVLALIAHGFTAAGGTLRAVFN